ncbi:MAG TPA: DUF2291 domain-containing protein [Clostridiaceae bacterium]|nr:DUF2291 domain-containing protein [Clostridiaceae bacterium]
MNCLKKVLLKLAVIIVFISILSSCTIVPDKDINEENGEQSDNGDIVNLVKKYWEEEIPDFVSENSVSIEEALHDDSKKIHCIHDKLIIEEFDDSSQNKCLIVSDYQNPTLKIQIGPIFKGTALRDGLTFIEADHFKNQIEFASVSSELHKYLVNEILKEFDPVEVVGKTIDIQGFLYVSNNELMITPTSISVEGD